MKPMNDHAQAPVRIPKPRRDYKDTLFRLLFQDRDRLLSLYNAVNGTSYDSPEELTVVPLENAVYMNMKNDMAFLVDFQLNLYEHQSTWNPNMPLRNLFYAAREYQTTPLYSKKSHIYRHCSHFSNRRPPYAPPYFSCHYCTPESDLFQTLYPTYMEETWNIN